VYERDRAAVLEKLARLRVQHLDGILGDVTRVSTGAFLTRWLEDVVRLALTAHTHDQYATTVRLHLTPHVGSINLGRLTPAHVQGMLSEMERTGASPRLRKLTFDVLHAALQQALRWNLVPRNVCDAATPPRVPRREIHPLVPEQVHEFLQAARESGIVFARFIRWRSGQACDRVSSWGCGGRMWISSEGRCRCAAPCTNFVDGCGSLRPRARPHHAR
jgi:hypothetical protein